MTPMTRPFGDDRSFRRALYGSLLFYLILAVITAVYPLPEKKREEITQLPPRIAKLILEPPKEIVKPAEKKPAVQKKEESPEKKAEKEIQKNKEAARKSGILKILSKDTQQGESLQNILQGAELGEVLSDTSVLTNVTETETPRLSQGAPVLSGGIGSVAPIAREMAGSSVIRLGEKRTSSVVVPPRRTQPVQSAGKPGERSPGSIAAIVASYRGGIDFVYKKTLRENPLLKGIVTVEFTIAPSGEVINCRIVSSSMNDPAFEDLLIKRILQWKFPPLPGGQNATVTYPLEFSPV